jgi:hypothetical protein
MGGQDVVVQLGRGGFETPARDLLPPLDRYARLVIGDEERLAGAVEASHGCSHRCRHCPLPVVYDGRLRVVPEQVVLSDVSQLVAMGARHITFGDPDFLNGPRHAVRVAQAIHSSFPDLSFDCTTKVEHILDHEDLWSGLAKVGCLFVVSAFESVDDKTLRILDKGHTAANESAAVTLLRSHGIEVRPSWLPFTPWTQAAEVDAMLDFVISHDLVRNVDAVQYTIRLLVPEGSLLLSVPEVKGRAGFGHLKTPGSTSFKKSWRHLSRLREPNLRCRRPRTRSRRWTLASASTWRATAREPARPLRAAGVARAGQPGPDHA